MQMRDPNSLPIGVQHFAQLMQRITQLEAEVRALRDTRPAYREFREVVVPSAPPSDHARMFVVDNGSGKTSLRVRFATGAVQTIATEP
jgi:hypothetical protein